MRRCYGCMRTIENEAHICPNCGYSEEERIEDNSLRPGTLLKGKYLTGKVIGAGGFGITYIGWDMAVEGVVAIKEYLPGDLATRVSGERGVTVYTGDETRQYEKGRESFIKEAEKLASLQNEKEICQVLDYFEENNTAYIVMEYLKGETLKSRLKKGDKKLPVDEALKIIREVLKGLSKVHAAGMLHRDIAPDNIYLIEDGSVKLFDFGSARTVMTSRTRSLTVEIKPGYSPVEQYKRHGNQGPWTDVYAAAATFYRMLTGHVPQGSMERKERDRLLPPSKMKIRIPKNVENALMNALCVEPEDRIQSAEELLRQLEDAETKRKKVRSIKADIGTLPLAVKILLPVISAALIISGVLLATGNIRFDTAHAGKQELEDGKIRIPSLIGASVTEASEKAEEGSFSIKITDKEYSDTIPISKILSQSIDAGSIVESGSVVEVVLSAGIEQAYAPYLTGLSKEEIEALLLEKGFKAEYIYEKSYVCPEHAVSQSPAEDTALNTGDTIRVILSEGNENIKTSAADEVPDLNGITWEEALKQAEEKGFYLTRKETVYSSEPENTITDQSRTTDPAAEGIQVIQTVVSAGRERTTVPDLYGNTEDSAKALLEASGLKYEITYEESSDTEEGKVLSQEIKAGERLPEETVINVVIGSGEPEPETQAPAANTQQRRNTAPRQNAQPAPQQPQGGEPPTIADNNG